MKNFKIGDKLTRFPLIQGGMGVGISLAVWQAPLQRKAGSESFPPLRSATGKKISTGIPKKPTSGYPVRDEKSTQDFS